MDLGDGVLIRLPIILVADGYHPTPFEYLLMDLYAVRYHVLWVKMTPLPTMANNEVTCWETDWGDDYLVSHHSLEEVKSCQFYTV